MTQHALWQLFRTRYGLQAQPALTLLDYQSASQQDGQLSLQATLRHHGETRRLQGQGNGLLSAAASGLSALFRQPFMIKDYHEHTLGARSDSRSVAYIRCVFPQGESYWGVGIDNDVARASLQALCNALSAADQAGGRK
ncbi:2-isopropylmalate synthase [Klebsiella pneumoniae]|nr:2-isopropylmalate synthase [Klebsiella pneumoniae]